MTEKYYTQVENSLISYLMTVNKTSQIKILLCIIRFTSGFHREKTELSASFIAKFTGLTRRTVIKELSELEKMRIIKRKNSSENYIKTVCINSEVYNTGGETQNTGDSEAKNTGGSEAQNTGGSEVCFTQEINNINKYISNKESKETHTGYKNFSKELLTAVNNWADIHNLNFRSRSVLENIIHKYVSDFGEGAVADIINQCIAEGRGSIYFDRLGKPTKKYGSPDIEAFTWNELSM